ncbi:MAG: pyridoxamine 5'-phosphate oxidase family protein, partial [Rhodospirillaceae bacterium]|nr:pyridoxamine 5'-phosphate oxidase family protein [Rhodospirillaceae bacterium]
MSGDDLDFARELARASAVASLATLDPDGGPPHASLVTVALDGDLSPVLLLSRLARHRRNLEE